MDCKKRSLTALNKGQIWQAVIAAVVSPAFLRATERSQEPQEMVRIEEREERGGIEIPIAEKIARIEEEIRQLEEVVQQLEEASIGRLREKRRLREAISEIGLEQLEEILIKIGLERRPEIERRRAQRRQLEEVGRQLEAELEAEIRKRVALSKLPTAARVA